MTQGSESEQAEQGQHSGSGLTQPIAALPPDPDDTQDVAMLMFRALTIITFSAGVACMVSNIITLVHSFIWEYDIALALMRVYAAVFACFVAVLETDWSWLMRKWPYMQHWFARGMIQTLVAVMTKGLSGSMWESIFERLLHDIPGYVMLVCGVIHISAGLVCVRQLRRRRHKTKEWRERALKDLQDIEAKRRHWQSILDNGVPGE